MRGTILHHVVEMPAARVLLGVWDDLMDDNDGGR